MSFFSFVSIAAWSPHRSASPNPRSSLGHFRSLSTISPGPSASRSRSPVKSLSSHNVTDMMTPSDKSPNALSPHGPRRMPSSLSVREDEDHNTIPDPRSRTLSTDATPGTSTPSHHPDLDEEVATLSTKLINAINHQTTLDDTLSSTRQELEAAHEKVAQLEEVVAKQQEKLTSEVWVRRSTVEDEKTDLRARLATERALRLEAEKEKKKIELELENLTVSLFEEANKMVITAKEEAAKEQDAVNRRNDNLKAQLKDTEGLLLFQQEQLAELKLVMEQMNAERDDRTGTAPSSPGLSKFDPRDHDHPLADGDSVRETTEPLSPTYPTNLSHLLSPVLRSDITAYDDFVSLIKISKMQPHSRVSSGSYNSLNPVLGLVGASLPSNGSTTSLTTLGGAASSSSPPTPHTPASASSASSNAPAVPIPALKETKFYKRALSEDVEPTLRLDAAPGLSWLARRSVITAITEGNLVVEPVPTTGVFATISKPQFYTCSLCGESRRDEIHLRNHRFRTSESETAQRYPLCKYCLGRVRSTCDFLGFLRMVKDGHWRADDEDSERNCWEESVKLREQMFWSRIGGGVVLASHGHHGHVEGKSTRNSTEVPRLSQDASKQVAEPAISSTRDEATPSLPPRPSHESAEIPATQSTDASATESVAEVTIETHAPESTVPEVSQTVTASSFTTQEDTEHAESTEVSAEQAEAKTEAPQENTEQAINSTSESHNDSATSLSISIPGAFAFNI